MRLNHVLVLCEQQILNAAFCRGSFVFTCLTYKNIQFFNLFLFVLFVSVLYCTYCNTKPESLFLER